MCVQVCLRTHVRACVRVCVPTCLRMCMVLSLSFMDRGELTPLTKLGELEKFAHHVCTHIAFKRIELESPGWSGFVMNSKPDQT